MTPEQTARLASVLRDRDPEPMQVVYRKIEDATADFRALWAAYHEEARKGEAQEHQAKMVRNRARQMVDDACASVHEAARRWQMNDREQAAATGATP